MMMCQGDIKNTLHQHYYYYYHGSIKALVKIWIMCGEMAMWREDRAGIHLAKAAAAGAAKEENITSGALGIDS